MNCPRGCWLEEVHVGCFGERLYAGVYALEIMVLLLFSNAGVSAQVAVKIEILRAH